jgi:hypothetical protein
MPEHEYGLLLDRIKPEEIAADLIRLAEIDLPYALEIREEIRQIEELRTIKPKTTDE